MLLAPEPNDCTTNRKGMSTKCLGVRVYLPMDNQQQSLLEYIGLRHATICARFLRPSFSRVLPDLYIIQTLLALSDSAVSPLKH